MVSGFVLAYARQRKNDYESDECKFFRKSNAVSLRFSQESMGRRIKKMKRRSRKTNKMLEVRKTAKTKRSRKRWIRTLNLLPSRFTFVDRAEFRLSSVGCPTIMFSDCGTYFSFRFIYFSCTTFFFSFLLFRLIVLP